MLMWSSVSSAQVEPRHEDHEALRAILKVAGNALNTRDINSLAPVLSEKFIITSVDQQTFTDLAAFNAYFQGFFEGEKPPLKSIEFNPKADALTEFIGENVGLARGTSNDIYHFSSGTAKEMTTRWTATVVKENGAWKLANLHLGVNVLDNPLIKTAKISFYWVGGVSFLIGLVLGFVLRRQRRS